MNTHLDFKNFVQLLKHNYLIIIVSVIVFGLCTFIISQFLISPQYTATSQVIIKQDKNAKGNVYSNPNEVQTNIQLIQTYSELISSDEIQNRAVKAIEKKEGTISKGVIKVQTVNNSQLIKIVAINKNPKIAVKMANEVARQSSKNIKVIMGVDNLYIFSQAKEYQVAHPSSPNTPLNTLLGIIFGLFVAFIIILVRKLLDNKVDNEEKVEQLLHLPVVGKIMDVGEKR